MIEPNYLPFILIGGGIIFRGTILSLCTIFPLAVCQSFGSTHFIGAIILNAHP